MEAHQNEKKLNNSINLQNNNPLNENNKLNDVNIFKKNDEIINPENIIFLKKITVDSYSDDYGLTNTFEVFKSINNILYLIYSNVNKSLISYNLNKQKIITELKGIHNYSITNIKHYLDKNKNKDLIMTISYKDNNVKLWDINNWEQLLNIKNANNRGILFSGSFLNENNNDYIITSNLFWDGEPEPIKIFDFNGNIIKKINNSNKNTFYVDSYYDKKLSKTYIIVCNEDSVKSYDYNENKLYHKYNDDNNNEIHKKIIIKNKNENIELIESCNDGNVRIWNFHLGILLNKINVCNDKLRDILLWDDNYLFVGCTDKIIRLIDLGKGLIVKNIEGHHNDILTIKKINVKEYGECLFSQGYQNDQIKMWIFKK